MSEILRAELAKVLDRYDEQRRTVFAREQKGRDEDQHFLAQFGELRRSVVWPAFEIAATMLVERGHRTSILEQDFSVGPDSKVVEAAISLNVAERYFSISTRHYNKTVAIDAGRPMEGAKNTYALEKVDRPLVEAELLKFVGAMVAA